MLISPETHLEETEPKPGMKGPSHYQKSQAKFFLLLLLILLLLFLLLLLLTTCTH